MLCAPVALVLLVLAGRWLLAMVALALIVATLAVEIPLYVGSNVAHTGGVVVRVITANLRTGLADPDNLVRSAEAQADVLSNKKLTPKQLTAYLCSWVGRDIPDTGGSIRRLRVGLWSRFPMHATRRIDGYSMAFVGEREYGSRACQSIPVSL